MAFKTCYCVDVYEDAELSDYFEDNWFWTKEEAEQYKKDREGKYFFEYEETVEVAFYVIENECVVDSYETYLDAVLAITKYLLAYEQKGGLVEEGDDTPNYYIKMEAL